MRREVWSSRRDWIMSDKSRASETVVVEVIRILAELEFQRGEERRERRLGEGERDGVIVRPGLLRMGEGWS